MDGREVQQFTRLNSAGNRSGSRAGRCGRHADPGDDLRYRPRRVIVMHWPPDADQDLDPRDVFVDATDVMARYGWGRAKGYQNPKDCSLGPAPVINHPGRWHLDQLLAWDEAHCAGRSGRGGPRRTQSGADLPHRAASRAQAGRHVG